MNLMMIYFLMKFYQYIIISKKIDKNKHNIGKTYTNHEQNIIKLKTLSYYVMENSIKIN